MDLDKKKDGGWKKRGASGHFRFSSKDAMKKMFYGKYNVFEEESNSQYSGNNHLNKVTSASGIYV